MNGLMTPGPIARLLRRGARRTAVGIDVGSRTFKAVQLERVRGGKARVVAAAIRPRTAEPCIVPAASSAAGGSAANAIVATCAPVNNSEVDALAQALGSAGFTGDRVVLAAPAEGLMVTPIELPPRSSQAPLEQLARMEVSRNFRCTPDSFEFSWWEMPAGMRGGRGTEAFAVALPHAKADSFLDPFDACHLDVQALETQQAALVRACRSALAEKTITAILDLGWGPATLGFVHHEMLTFSRRIPEGAVGSLHAALCKTLSIDGDVADYLLGEVGLDSPPAHGAGGPASETAVEMPDEGIRLITAFTETLIKELSLSFSYATHQYPDAAVAKLLLVGGGAGMAGLAHRLAAALGVDVATVAPVDIAACDPSLLSLCSSPSMTMALGLAMRELE